VDAATLEQWYAAYGYAVHRRCMRLLRSRVEADDALHEVFLRVYRYGHTLQGEAPLSWLYRIADRHCLDALRKRGRHVSREEREELTGEQVGEVAATGSLEETRLLGQVLAACKPPVRDTAVLYYVDELTQDEVAESLGCSRKTVKERLAQFKVVATRMLTGGWGKRGVL
jgi:RNA polymerase sigma-70 factor (ECF subfamily)